MGSGKTKVESTAEQLAALKANLPSLMKAYGDNILPYETAALEARKVIEPAEMQMILDNYKKYGKQFNEIGTETTIRNARDLATAESETLAGPGNKLIEQALASERLADPEYYRTRETVSTGLNDLIGQLTSSNDTVSEEISRGLARSNPYDHSNTKIIANAMQFGNQGLQRQDMLSKALGQASNALPQLKSGVDAFQIGTGRTAYAMNNPGASMIPQTNRSLGANTTNAGAGLLANINRDSAQNATLADAAKQRKQQLISDSIAAVAALGGGAMKL